MYLCDYMVFMIIFVSFSESQLKQPCNYHNKSLPIPLSQYQIAHFNNSDKVYIFGGESVNGTNSNAIYRWDLSNHSNNTFFEPEPITVKTPHSIFQSWTNNVVVIHDKAWFIGMYHSNTDYSTKFYVFDSINEKFIHNESLQPPPHQGIGGCVATNVSHIFMIGGKYFNKHPHNVTYYDYLQIYDIETNKWTSIETNVRSANQFCQMVNNALYVFFGSSPSVRRLSDYYKYENNKWSKIGTTSFGSCCGASVSFDSQIFIIEGETDNGGGTVAIDSNRIQIFDINQDTITHTFYMNESLQLLSSLVIDQKLYTFGGWSKSKSETVKSVQVCDLEAMPHPKKSQLDQMILFILCVSAIFILICFAIVLFVCKTGKKQEEMRRLMQRSIDGGSFKGGSVQGSASRGFSINKSYDKRGTIDHDDDDDMHSLSGVIQK